MKPSRIVAIGVIAASLALAANVRAQSLRNVDIPNEFPPSSFKGRQYVDSKGCVYIRAGVAGSVTWVPRMTRDRKVICGYKPTFDEASRSTTSAAKINKNAVVIQPADPAAPAAAAAPKAKTKTKAAAAPAQPKTATSAKAKTKAAAKPKPAAAAKSPATQAKTTTKPKPAVAAAATTPATRKSAQPRRTTTQAPRASGSLSPCRDGTATHKGFQVRCGPQSESPVTPGTGNPTAEPPKMKFRRSGDQQSRLAPGTVVKPGEAAPDTRVVPRHVYESRAQALAAPAVPEGYRRAFDDGRLNPRRAEMSLAGVAATNRIWTQTVPRRLRRGEEAPGDPIRVQASAQEPAGEPAIAPPPVVSTRSEAPTRTLRLGGTRYVQVATYDDAARAQSEARRVRALGLPVRIGKYNRNGQTKRIVLAGPFAEASAQSKALERTRRAGYAQAFARN